MTRRTHPLISVRRIGAITAIGAVAIGGTGIALGAVSNQTGTTFTCDGRQAGVIGTNGNDAITGTPGDDVIVGLAGDDIVNGNGGNDLICLGHDHHIVR